MEVIRMLMYEEETVVTNRRRLVAYWVLLHTGDLPILWSDGGPHYHLDLLGIDTDSTRWIVEVKKEKEMTSAEV